MHFWCGIPYKPSFATVTGGGVGVDPKDPPSPGGHLHPKEILLIVKTLALTWDLDEPPWFNWDLDEPPWFKHTYIYIYIYKSWKSFMCSSQLGESWISFSTGCIRGATDMCKDLKQHLPHRCSVFSAKRLEKHGKTYGGWAETPSDLRLEKMPKFSNNEKKLQ